METKIESTYDYYDKGKTFIELATKNPDEFCNIIVGDGGLVYQNHTFMKADILKLRDELNRMYPGEAPAPKARYVVEPENRYTSRWCVVKIVQGPVRETIGNSMSKENAELIAAGLNASEAA